MGNFERGGGGGVMGRMGDGGPRLQVTGCRLQVTGYKSSLCNLQLATCNFFTLLPASLPPKSP